MGLGWAPIPAVTLATVSRAGCGLGAGVGVAFQNHREPLFSMSPPALTLSLALLPLFQGLWRDCRSPSSFADKKVRESSWPCSLAGLCSAKVFPRRPLPFPRGVFGFLQWGAAARLGLANGRWVVGYQARSPSAGMSPGR